jgi:hypothetical protein
MNMTRTIAYVVALLCAVLAVSCATRQSAGKSGGGDVLYVCGCGDACKCQTILLHGGKCGCGHDLVPGHLKKVEGDVAFLCMCATGCKCGVNATDPTRCGCGNPIRKVSLKGTGVYFCNCQGSCVCKRVSDKPGQCHCGMPLKKVD